MSIVTLVSGGLDSTLMALLTAESEIEQFPLFIDYGQIFFSREYNACIKNFENLHLPRPRRMSLGGFGHTIPSGLTTRKKDVLRDAFLPNRNLLFLVCAGAYAQTTGAAAVAIGLLSESNHLFPDQTQDFLSSAQVVLFKSLGREIKVVAPLMQFSKAEVVALARQKKIKEWYSCHSGQKKPCGRCISCREYKFH